MCPLNQIKEIMLEITLKEKSVYGKTLLYPNCPKSHTFTQLLDKKTFTYTDVHYIEKLGYKVTIQPL